MSEMKPKNSREIQDVGGNHVVKRKSTDMKTRVQKSKLAETTWPREIKDCGHHVVKRKSTEMKATSSENQNDGWMIS